ncbi:Hypothetical predicted protein [Paramuricea clavata]|uniref:Uncharacterized protein n=1 Tax=Paramuricea clavata TaxID=317549 RepID=A0A6S7FP42_PARCT|nr:Hypothetical predicted protein [Paramuricea clavata]
MNEYIQHRKRTDVPTKNIATIIGKQPGDNIWILIEGTFINEVGELLKPEDTNYIWLSSIYSHSTIAALHSRCEVATPLTPMALEPLILKLFPLLEHNAFSAILMLDAGAMSWHYLTILENNKNCPVAVAYGPSGTGKTTGLFAALSIIGAHEPNFYSRGTKESYISILSKQTVPIGLDDPQSSKNVSELLIDLFGGAMSKGITRGVQQPIGTVIASANFTPTDSAR